MSQDAQLNTNLPPHDTGMATFATALAAYFMDFLETNLHKRRLPKRSIKPRDRDGLLIGISGRKYPEFSRDVWNVLYRGIDSNSKLAIRQGQYTAQIPKNLLTLIRGFCNASVSESLLSTLVNDFADRIQKAHTTFPNNLEESIEQSLESCAIAFESLLVEPLLALLSEPLGRHSSGGDDLSGTIRKELSKLLVLPLEPHCESIMQRLELKESIDIAHELGTTFSVESMRAAIIGFFDELALSDMYFEVRELLDNKHLKDKCDVYVYLGELRHDGMAYPIFYLPVQITQTAQTYQVAFDSICYINRKAIEFITQEANKVSGRRGRITSARERILYPGEHREDFVSHLDKITTELGEYFRLESPIALREPHPQESRGNLLTVSNTCHLYIFDKSDEALVNDYEELLTAVSDGDEILLAKFQELVENFIRTDPIQYTQEVNGKWDHSDFTERLVYECPIPLNAEQRKILLALQNEQCKYVAVEGPPGTGKSHTITALVFDAILHGKSVLVLSDKREALDVVEGMITRVLNKVRFAEDFQNPVLRLGKTGNTYAQILSMSSLENIRNQYNATKNKYPKILKSISKRKAHIQDLIKRDVIAHEQLSLEDISKYHSLEQQWLEDNSCPVDIDELFVKPNGLKDIDAFRACCKLVANALQGDFAGSQIVELYPPSPDDGGSIIDFRRYMGQIAIAKSIMQSDQDKLPALRLLRSWGEEGLAILNRVMVDYEDLHLPILGYLFRGKQIASLERDLNSPINWVRPIRLRADRDALRDIRAVSLKVSQLCQQHKKGGPLSVKDKMFARIHSYLMQDLIQLYNLNVDELLEASSWLEQFSMHYPSTSSQMQLDSDSLDSYLECDVAALTDEGWLSLKQFLELRKTLHSAFTSLPLYDFKGLSEELQEECTHKMTHTLDGRVIHFHDNYKATAKTIRECVRKKIRFPKDNFIKVKEAFPCIISSVRDYAEYIPLESDIFDLVIIDEASQVSIAQSFPALLRGRTVVVFGDSKQFSNVKAALARSDLNKDYVSRIEGLFKEHVSNDPAELLRLKKFNIKTSVLEFFGYISNFEIMLRKHFRGYREHISYSSKYFYGGHLQAIKIRGIPIDEALRFTILEHDGLLEPITNTNAIEAGYIIEQLLAIKERQDTPSVGIITPHTNQQKYISNMISRMPEREYFYDKLGLKVMTFDTCQGEERDIVYYSMVAHPGMDRLWGIFPKSLQHLDLEETGNLKAQRLNVGFSRVKETMHLVLSKPPEAFSNTIGEALLHYKEVLSSTRRLPTQDDVDPRSPMEGKVLEWIKDTQFFQEHAAHTELKTQFPIGKYLQQLDPTYRHPGYRTDFLLIFKDEDKKPLPIIIEYDGFKEHFVEHGEIDATNFDEYYTRDHIERQKTLEDYGYKFLRLNRFNLGKDPVKTIDLRLQDLLKKNGGASDSDLTFEIHTTITDLRSGEQRKCPRCGKLQKRSFFLDSTLKSGKSRNCSDCRDRVGTSPRSSYTRQKRRKKKSRKARAKPTPGKSCPRCDSPMTLRSGRYGMFYGCIKYPTCKGTTSS